MSGFFRGTSTDQVKHVNAEQKLIKELQKKGKFPPHFAKKVDISKVSMEVLKPWIAKRITEMLGFEDEVVVDLCIAHLEEKSEKGLDPKLLQVTMTGFMAQKAAPFCSELWAHLLSAQESEVGVPQDFIEQKKEELRQKKEEAERMQEELRRRKQDLERAQQANSKATAPETSRNGGRDDGGRRRSRSRSRGRRGGGGGDRDRDRRSGRGRSRSLSPEARPRDRRR